MPVRIQRKKKLHICGWECELLQSLWKSARRFLKKLKKSIYKIIWTCRSIFIIASFTIVKL
jgi:hypothetical protein